MQIIQDHQDQIHHLCLNHQVKRLYVFGSVLTERFNESSDIDFVVEFEDLDPLVYMDHYFAVKFGLEEILKRKVDLLEDHSIVNPVFRAALDRTKKLIYEGRSPELVS